MLHELLAAMWGGPVAIAMWLLRNMRRLTWRDLMFWAIVLCAGAIIVTMAANQVIFLRDQYFREIELTEKAVLQVQACKGLADILMGEPGVEDACFKARAVVKKSAASRAVEALVKTWPAPHQFISFVFATAERQYYALCIGAALLALFWWFTAPLRGYAYDEMMRRRAMELYLADQFNGKSKPARRPPAFTPKTVSA